MTAEINENEMKKTVQKIKDYFFEKINKIDKPLARLTEKKEKTQIIKSEMKKETLPLIPQKNQRIISGYYEQL